MYPQSNCFRTLTKVHPLRRRNLLFHRIDIEPCSDRDFKIRSEKFWEFVNLNLKIKVARSNLLNQTVELLSSDWILPSYRAHSSWLVGTVSTHSLKDSQLLICRDSIGALEAGISGHDGEEKSEQQPEDRRAA